MLCHVWNGPHTKQKKTYKYTTRSTLFVCSTIDTVHSWALLVVTGTQFDGWTTVKENKHTNTQNTNILSSWEQNYIKKIFINVQQQRNMNKQLHWGFQTSNKWINVTGDLLFLRRNNWLFLKLKTRSHERLECHLVSGQKALV